MMCVETNCSICNRKIGGRLQYKEMRLLTFLPDKTGTFRSSDGICLCNRCKQSFYSWMKNRRKAFTDNETPHTTTINGSIMD